MDAPSSLVMDFLEWVAHRPRPYAEVMGAWRTSCPRLTVWEDALDEKLVHRTTAGGRGEIVEITEAGREYLAQRAV